MLDYSLLSACSGSTLVARRAGMIAAARATSSMNALTAINVAGSSGVTPNSSADVRRVSAAAPSNPITSPVAASPSPCRSTIARTPFSVAPSAMRMPISRRRSMTANASTP